jgi:hypothetical protein
MKVYIDNCCYNRPFDSFAQARIRAEAVAVRAAVKLFNRGKKMGTVAIDLNNTAAVITAGRRVLVDALGADGARVFLNSYQKEGGKLPRITDAEMAEIMAEAEAEIEVLSPHGFGDYTAEKYDRPEPSQKELFTSFRKREAEMDTIKREHPEYTIQETIHEQARRETSRRGVTLPITP